MNELRICPFCGRKLLHMAGKAVNRYYKNEPTMYQHPQCDDCILGQYGEEVQVREWDIEAWNRRAEEGEHETERC